MTTDAMFGWLPYFGAISALVLLTAALDTLHAIRRDLARLRRESQEPRAVVVPRPVELRPVTRRGMEEAG